VDRLIAEARERLRADPVLKDSPSCFIEALLAARERDPESLSEQDVFANAVTVLLGGEDTTATTLSWLIHHCCEHPQVFEGLRVEADALLDAAPDNGGIPMADRFAPYLERTDAALNETLRLNPIAPIYGLTARRDAVLAGVRVPSGTDLFLLPRAAAGCAPSSTPSPRFDPAATHAATDPSARGPGRAVTLPFGYGPRMCPGRNLALAEQRTVTLLLARHFDLEAVPGPAPVSECFSFTLVPQNLRVRLHRRRLSTGTP